MQAHREETTLSEDGVVTLHGVPFRRGESVEVIILPVCPSAPANALRSLEGIPVTLIDPFDPAVPEDEWEANRWLCSTPTSGFGGCIVILLCPLRFAH